MVGGRALMVDASCSVCIVWEEIENSSMDATECRELADNLCLLIKVIETRRPFPTSEVRPITFKQNTYSLLHDFL